MMSKAIEDILAERKKQIEKYGFDSNHDDENDYFSMSNFGVLYALHSANELDGDLFERLFPANWDIKWWKPEGQRSSLVKAAAMIIAELEAWDREDNNE